MMSDGQLVDGSWELTVTVSDLQVEKIIRVRGDMHVGGVMLQLVDALDIAMDWSDHALWWPARSLWLSRARSTLDQYGVQADARLVFTPMHKVLRVKLPDLQLLDMRISFSSNVFAVVVRLCKELGIRHPEELSLTRKVDREGLKRNQGISATRKQRPAGLNMTDSSMDGTLTPGSPYRHPTSPNTPQGTLLRVPGSPYNTLSSISNVYNGGGGGGGGYGTMSPGSMQSLSFDVTNDSMLAVSPSISAHEALLQLYRPRNFAEKARINAGWLDSSRSLLEQGIEENELVMLRFKFFNFYDLNPKYDAVRINQMYEQAKWSLISEETDCTEEEMMMFAALQHQVQLQSMLPQSQVDGAATDGGIDEIDSALDELQVSLEGSSMSTAADITRIPELQDYLRFFKPKKFTIKSYKKYYFVFKDTRLSMFRGRDSKEQSLMDVSLRGCEVNQEVNITNQKFIIKIFIPTEDGLSEVWLRADSEEQYAKWMAACRVASKGKTMADSTYEAEVNSILKLLSMQHPAPVAAIANGNGHDERAGGGVQADELVAARFLRKLKGKQMNHRIMEAHANLRDMTLIEAKLTYIKAWQVLPEFGITYLIVRMKGSKKEELMGIAFNRLIRMDLHSGDSLKTWRFSNMKTWSVNWEIKEVQVRFEKEDVVFSCLTADCKVVHEFIGGYIFLSMRAGDKNQSLNEEMFHKLTGGWL